jgi:hypothetical protein
VRSVRDSDYGAADSNASGRRVDPAEWTDDGRHFECYDESHAKAWATTQGGGQSSASIVAHPYRRLSTRRSFYSYCHLEGLLARGPGRQRPPKQLARERHLLDVEDDEYERHYGYIAEQRGDTDSFTR